MKKILIALLLSAACASAMAANWKTFAESTTHQYQGDIQSLKFGTNKGDEPIVYVKGRVVPIDGSVKQEMWSIRLEHCEAGGGYLVTMNTEGVFQAKNPVTEGGTSIADGIAEKLCHFYARAKAISKESGSSI